MLVLTPHASCLCSRPPAPLRHPPAPPLSKALASAFLSADKLERADGGVVASYLSALALLSGADDSAAQQAAGLPLSLEPVRRGGASLRGVLFCFARSMCRPDGDRVLHAAGGLLGLARRGSSRWGGAWVCDCAQGHGGAWAVMRAGVVCMHACMRACVHV
jgi:hypothetical protein